jgi:hypothetical protein
LMGYRKEPLFVASLNRTLALSRSSLLSSMSVAAQAGVAGKSRGVSTHATSRALACAASMTPGMIAERMDGNHLLACLLH